MKPEPVEISKLGHPYHGRSGLVIDKHGDSYTVEFIDHDGCMTSHHIENFSGRELRAIRVRV